MSQEAALTRHQAPWRFDLRLPAPRAERNECLLFVSPQVCGIFVLPAPGDEDTMLGVSNAKNHKIETSPRGLAIQLGFQGRGSVMKNQANIERALSIKRLKPSKAQDLLVRADVWQAIQEDGKGAFGVNRRVEKSLPEQRGAGLDCTLVRSKGLS